MDELESACGSDPREICRITFEWTGNEFVASMSEWLVDRPLRLVFIVVVAFFANKLAGKAIHRSTERLVSERSEVDDETERLLSRFGRLSFAQDQRARSEQRTRTLGVFVSNAASVVICVVALMLILDLVGLDVAPLIASAGVAGIAIGFGAQSLIRDVLAGMFVVIEDQYGVGDFIDVGDATGNVEEVALRVTRLRDAQGVLWIVPNGEIRRVGNYSQHFSKFRLEIEVSYDADIDHAMAVIKEVLDDVWQSEVVDATIIEEPEVLGVEAFRDSAVVLSAVVKTDPSEQWRVARLIRRNIKHAFDDEGIEIPFPQRTVWLREAKEPQMPLADGSVDAIEP